MKTTCTRSARPGVIAGYNVVGPRYYPYQSGNPRSVAEPVSVFVQRASMRGRPWLRFTQASEGSAERQNGALFYVSGYPTLRQAVA